MKNDKDLKPNFQKTVKNGYPYPLLNYFRVERYVTRPLASLIVRAVFRTPVTPNQLTCVSFFLGMASGLCFCGGSSIYFAAGGVLAYLSSILDCADGMLARAKDSCTRYGAYLDLFLDRIADLLIFSGINIGYFRHSQDLTLFSVGFIGISLYFLQVSLYYIIHAFKRMPQTGQASEARGLTLFAIMIFGVTGQLKILYLLVILFGVLSILFKIVHFIRLGRKKDQASET